MEEPTFDYEGGLEEDVNGKNDTNKPNKDNEKRNKNKNKENEEEKEESDDEEEKEEKQNENEKEDEQKEEEEKERKEKEQKSKEKEKVTRKENNYENGNGLPKQPILQFGEYKKDDGTVATWESMTEKDWTNWDLDNPPGENHKFWLLDAKIIKHAIEHWIFEDVKITIPYNWYPVTFTCNRKYPPIRPNADQKVIRRGTMLEVYDTCNKYINKFINYPDVEKQIIYTPSLAKPKKLLRESDEENKELIKTMTSMQNNKARFRLQGNIAKANSASLIFIKKQKRQQLLATIMQNASIAEKKAYQIIGASLDYRRELEADELDAAAQEEADDLIFIKELKELENENRASDREDNDVLANDTTEPQQNVNNPNLENIELLQNNMNENDLNIVTILSQNSTISTVGQDQLTTQTEPAGTVVEVHFSKDTTLKDKYIKMKLSEINWEDKSKRELTVNLDPDTMSTLNRDTREAAKVISNLLQLTEAKRWSSICTRDIYAKDGMLMKCVKTRPLLQSIDELKHTPECNQIRSTLDGIVEQYQYKVQKELNKYTELEIKYHDKQRFVIMEEKLRYLIRLQATKIVTEFNEQKRMQMLVKGIANRCPITCDEVCGFAYLFLLTGRTCNALSEWADVTNEVMMNNLTTTLKYPERILETEIKESNSIKIGTLNVKRPSNDTWTVAMSVAADLQELVAEMTLGSKTKFYNSIIEEKGLKAVRDLRYTRETIEKSARVSDILKNTKDIKSVMELNKWKKDTVKSIMGQIHKKQNALARYSKALGVRDTDINNKDSSTTHVSETQTQENTSRKDLSKCTQKTATSPNNSTKNKTQSEINNKNQTQNNKKQKQNEEDNQTVDKSPIINPYLNKINKNKDGKVDDDDDGETTTNKTTTTQQGNYKGNNYNPNHNQQFRRGGYNNYNERGQYTERHNNRVRLNDRDDSHHRREDYSSSRFQRGGRGRGRGGRTGRGRGRDSGGRTNYTQAQQYEGDNRKAGDKRRIGNELNKQQEGNAGKKQKG